MPAMDSLYGSMLYVFLMCFYDLGMFVLMNLESHFESACGEGGLKSNI